MTPSIPISRPVRGSLTERPSAKLLVAVCMLSMLVACGPRTEAEHLAAARKAVEARDFATAIVQLKQTLQRNPESLEARLDLASTLLKAGDVRSALLELDKVEKAGFDPAKTKPVRAQALVAANEPRRLINELADTTLTDPLATAEVRALVATAHALLGEFDKADAVARSALAADARNPNARRLLARMSAMKGDLETANNLLIGLLADSSSQHETRQLEGEILWRRNQDAAGAAAAFRRALALDPSYIPAHAALLAVLQRQGDMAAYREHIKQLSQVMPRHPMTLLYRGRLALSDGDLNLARDMSQALLRSAPDDATALGLAGMVELRRNALVLAQSHLTKAVQLAPADALPRQLLAETYIRLSQPQRALDVLRPILAGTPTTQALSVAGQAHLLMGDAGGAEALFTRAAASSPDDPQIQTAIALTHIAAGRVDSGLAQLDRLAEDSRQTHADMARISALFERRDWQAALLAIDRLIEKTPQAALPYHLRAHVQMKLNDPAGARASWERAINTDPTFFEGVASLGLLDLMAGNAASAQQRTEAFLKANPNDSRAMSAIADLRRRAGAPPSEVQRLLEEAIRANSSAGTPRLLLIDHHLTQGNLPAALTAAQEAVAANPEDPLLLDALGRVQLAGGDAEQAVATFNRIATAYPAMPQPLLRLADIHTRLRNYTAARQVLQRALLASPQLVDAQRALARVALLDGRQEEALTVARTVQRQRPAEAVGYLMESEIFASQRRWPAAVNAAKAALERQRNASAAVHLHTQLLAAGRADEARVFAAEWLRAEPADTDFLMYLGSVAMQRRAYGEAEARFREVLKHRARDPVALNNVAWTMLQQRKPDALAFAQRASEVAPNEPALLDTLASALLADGQATRALEVQRLAAARAPNAPEIYLNLARILLETGERAEARGILTKLGRLGAGFDRQEEVAALLERAR